MEMNMIDVNRVQIVEVSFAETEFRQVQAKIVGVLYDSQEHFALVTFAKCL